MAFSCDFPGCDKAYGTNGALRIHYRAVHTYDAFKCLHCNELRNTKDGLMRHIRRDHPTQAASTAGAQLIIGALAPFPGAIPPLTNVTTAGPAVTSTTAGAGPVAARDSTATEAAPTNPEHAPIRRPLPVAPVGYYGGAAAADLEVPAPEAEYPFASRPVGLYHGVLTIPMALAGPHAPPYRFCRGGCARPPVRPDLQFCRHCIPHVVGISYEDYMLFFA